MNTIKDLAKNWWAKLNWSFKGKFSFEYYPTLSINLITKEKIENIFYNEVILKWWVNYNVFI